MVEVDTSFQRPAMTCTPDLFTAELEATLAFYTETLGFTVNTLWPTDEPSMCILDRDGASLMFHTERWDAEEVAHLTGQIRIDVADCSALHAAVVERGSTEVLWGPEVFEYGRREFSVRDPNGYRLVFSEATSEPATCSE